MNKLSPLLLFILAFSGVASAAVAGHQTRTIEGWTVQIDDRLMTTDKAGTEKSLVILAAQLKEVARVVPAGPVARLRKVTLWFSPPYPNAPPVGEYHPSAAWLSQNGRNPAMAKGIEFTNVRIFEAETQRMPSLVLHELAHAYHDQVLGYDNAEIKAAYERAVASKSYDLVERRNGPCRPNNTFERAYAMNHVQEYFTETSEAFFGHNDFFPFTRDELTRHDPTMAALLQRLWQVTAPLPAPAPPPAPPTAGSPFNANCYYRLTTQWRGDDMSLDILYDGKSNNVPILARTRNVDGQMWKLTPVANGAYRLTTQWRGEGLSLAITAGNRPLLVNSVTAPEQAWKLTPLGNGFYRMTTQAQGDGMSLDIVNDGGANNIPILAKTGNFSGQMWKVVPVALYP
jgi:hypothetical protein